MRSLCPGLYINSSDPLTPQQFCAGKPRSIFPKGCPGEYKPCNTHSDCADMLPPAATAPLGSLKVCRCECDICKLPVDCSNDANISDDLTCYATHSLCNVPDDKVSGAGYVTASTVGLLSALAIALISF